MSLWLNSLNLYEFLFKFCYVLYEFVFEFSNFYEFVFKFSNL